MALALHRRCLLRCARKFSLDALSARTQEIERKVLSALGNEDEVQRLRQERDHLEAVLSDASAWECQDTAQVQSKRLLSLQQELASVDEVFDEIESARALLELLEETDQDAELTQELEEVLALCDTLHEKMIIQRKLNEPFAMCDCYVQVTAGQGGAASRRLVKKLRDMYVNYATKEGWEIEELDCTVVEDGDGDGLSNTTLLVQGDHCFGWLRHEHGVHRHKYVYWKGSKKHTDAVAVRVTPHAPSDGFVRGNEVDEELKRLVDVDNMTSELKFETMRASGAGGQHVNTTDSAVRVTHLETGISAKVGKSRSQASNRQKALDLLRARLIEHYLSARRKTAEGVSEQTGQAVINREDQHFGMRIRTYNEFYNEAVDHRSDFRAPVHQILDGDLREMLRHNLLVL